MCGARVTGRCLGVALVCVLAAQAVAFAQPLPARQDRLEQWLDAVREHAPGTQDAAFETVAAWSISDVRTLWTQVEFLIWQMRARNRVTFSVGVAGMASIGSTASPRVRPVLACAAAGRALDATCLNLKGQVPAAVYGPNLLALSEAVDAGRRRGDGDNYILRRGALLHADVAMLAPPVVESAPDAASLRERYRVQIVDGHQRSFGRVPVHWQIARMLLDNVQRAAAKRPELDKDAMVRLWYQATATWMQWHSDYEAAHLERALEIFSSDADILFLAACIHEAYASSRIQNAVRALALPTGVRADLGSPRDELRQAERFLRRAVAARPAFTEAHLHLGRVLSLLGRPADAVGHLTKAIGGTEDQLLLYYGHLFLGAAYEALRQDAQSRTAYERAATLFPRAQAPHLGLTQLARRRGERDAALNAIQTVFKIGAAAAAVDDPWWRYYTSQGRRADDLLTQLVRPFLSNDSR
jgi:tetratricopeptide (TPR) repeat protein